MPPCGVLPEHLEALCPELGAVVQDAASHGNPVVETWRGFGNAARLASARPVLVALPEQVLGNLRYRAVDDPHYWLGEIHCLRHPDWFVALPFKGHDGTSLGLPAAD